MLFTFLINTLITGSGYALVALAFRLMYSVSPFFNFTIGSLIAFAAYTLYYLGTITGLSPVIAIPLTLALTSLAAFLLEIAVYRPMTKKGASFSQRLDFYCLDGRTRVHASPLLQTQEKIKVMRGQDLLNRQNMMRNKNIFYCR